MPRARARGSLLRAAGGAGKQPHLLHGGQVRRLSNPADERRGFGIICVNLWNLWFGFISPCLRMGLLWLGFSPPVNGGALELYPWNEFHGLRFPGV